MSAEQ